MRVQESAIDFIYLHKEVPSNDDVTMKKCYAKYKLYFCVSSTPTFSIVGKQITSNWHYEDIAKYYLLV